MTQTKVKGRMVVDEKKVVLIGGHPRWQKFFKKDNPHVTIVSDKNRTSPRGILDHADKVLINTNHISHTKYVAYMNLIKSKGIEVQYVR